MNSRSTNFIPKSSDPSDDCVNFLSENVGTLRRFQWRYYVRPLRPPLQTRYGLWSQREGIIVRLEAAAGRVGFGEIAPLPWFGSETLAAAIAHCSALAAVEPEVLPRALAAIPDTLPACQFGLLSAWDRLLMSPQFPAPSPAANAAIPRSAVLLPTGAAALTAWEAAWNAGDRTFKWKIGVESVSKELCTWRELRTQLPATATLRLDANGGLSVAAARRWLEVCATEPRVEFLEQPLPPSEWVAMQALSRDFPTPIALDESVATLAQLEAWVHRGWAGVFVVKPAIAGAPQRLLALCHQHHLDVVISSVFETAIARTYLQTRLLPALPPPLRAPGLGTAHWFPDDDFETTDFAALWHRLQPGYPPA